MDEEFKANYLRASEQVLALEAEGDVLSEHNRFLDTERTALLDKLSDINHNIAIVHGQIVYYQNVLSEIEKNRMENNPMRQLHKIPGWMSAKTILRNLMEKLNSLQTEKEELKYIKKTLYLRDTRSGDWGLYYSMKCLEGLEY